MMSEVLRSQLMTEIIEVTNKQMLALKIKSVDFIKKY